MTHDPRAIDRDGAIWLVDFVAANRLLPRALREPLEAEGSNALTAEMLAAATPGLSDLDALDTDFVVSSSRRRSTSASSTSTRSSR